MNNYNIRSASLYAHGNGNVRIRQVSSKWKLEVAPCRTETVHKVFLWRGEVPFCRIGGDNALERLSRSMKVSEGLVGITLNASARTKVFSLCSEAYEINS